MDILTKMWSIIEEWFSDSDVEFQESIEDRGVDFGSEVFYCATLKGKSGNIINELEINVTDCNDGDFIRLGRKRYVQCGMAKPICLN